MKSKKTSAEPSSIADSGNASGPPLAPSRAPQPAPAALLDWFQASRRPLPWRTAAGTPRDPWATLVSESMAQQTRMEVVVPRFADWMERFPSPQALAQATEAEALAAWAGLGYYARARNLRRAAQAVAQRGGFPATAEELEKLPGIGPYTAAAIASLCFGERVAVVDGNVVRVLARIYAWDVDAATTSGRRALAEAATAWVTGQVAFPLPDSVLSISAGDPAAFDAGAINEATMELGALVCTPRNPRCGACPLASHCAAYQAGSMENFPRPRQRGESVDVTALALVVRGPRGLLMRRAAPRELLAGLWTLPVVPLPVRAGQHPAFEGDLFGSPIEEALAALPGSWNSLSWRLCDTPVRHSITRHRIVWWVAVADAPYDFDSSGLDPVLRWIATADVPHQVVSSLIRKALDLADRSEEAC